MSLQNIAILTQPQPWQGSADAHHMPSLDRALKANTADTEASKAAQEPSASLAGSASLARPWGRVGVSGNAFAADFPAPSRAGGCCRVVC